MFQVGGISLIIHSVIIITNKIARSRRVKAVINAPAALVFRLDFKRFGFGFFAYLNGKKVRSSKRYSIVAVKNRSSVFELAAARVTLIKDFLFQKKEAVVSE